jgi:hypothetical protein
MKFAWRNNIPNLAALNSAALEEVDLGEFQELLAANHSDDEFELIDDEIVLD